MANPSKRYPWVVVMRPLVGGRWYAVEAHRDEEIARAMAKLNENRTVAEWRVVHVDEWRNGEEYK